MESPQRVNRACILKRKANCPSCGRLVTLKYLAAIEAWAARAEDRAKDAFRKRQARQQECVHDSAQGASDMAIHTRRIFARGKEHRHQRCQRGPTASLVRAQLATNR